MAQLPKRANTEGNREASTDFTPVPAGIYNVAIIKSELKETKKKDGYYLDLQMKIQEGEYEGRLVFAKLNLVNKNKIAEEIANKQLNAICQACDVDDCEDSEELHGIPFNVRVIVEEATSDWPAKNEIKAFGVPDPEESENTDGYNEDDMPWNKK